MTTELLPWRSLPATSIEEVSRDQHLTSTASATSLTMLDGHHQRRINKLSSTNLLEETTGCDEIGIPPVARIYPQIFDEKLPAGQALVYIHNAHKDAQSALDAFGAPDFQAVATRLAQIAATMAKTHSLTGFNENFGAVVSFIRRATLLVSPEEISRSALNSLIHALRSLSSNPMIDLDESSDLVDTLINEGWQGEHGVADALIAALINETDIETEEKQTLLFPES